MNNNKIPETDSNYSYRVVEKFLELSRQGKLNYSDEIKVIAHFDKKYEFMTVAEYAKLIGKQYKIVQDKIEHRTIAFLHFAGKYFIPKNLN
jgi:hypothetical protein